ncbi:MAG: hypothetical protein CMJ31_13005 [Phycisphaerae bacterium]|nr:hypothetical protein [Phycisphaerae bacterium]
MSLPSQTTRTGVRAGRSATVYRRRKRGSKLPPPALIGGFVGLAALGGLAFLIVRIVAGATSGDDSAAQLASDEREVETESPTPATPSARIEPRPTPQSTTPSIPRSAERERPTDPNRVVIDQGSRRATEETTRAEPTPANTSPVVDPLKPAVESRLGDAIAAQGERGGERSTPPTTPSRNENTTAPSAHQITTQTLRTADTLIAQSDPLAARELLSVGLRDNSLTAMDRSRIRMKLSELNEKLVFGPVATPGDPITESYTVRSGDRLSTIAARRELATHWRLIQRVNGLANPNVIRVGQSLKLVRGPFHAIVDKSDYRLDLYHGPPDDPSRWLFIRSFTVGLGEQGSTPTGRFKVRLDSKLENPAWVNPRNPSERYDGDDPRNPIGEFWIGLDGEGEDAVYTGYGIHGTIAPDSIGKQESMGCVRLLPDDIALMYECLVEGISRVRIVD